MSSLNQCQIIGRLGQDPKVKSMESGNKVANFSMATDESYKDKSGNKVEKTEWHNIVAWGKLAEIIEKWVHKGDLIFIQGKLQTRKWDKDGVTHYSTEVVADRMQMLGGKRGDGEQSGGGVPSGPDNSDLPF